MFIWILGGLFCVSFLLSVFSLWRDLKKNIKTEHVTEELSKGRVIFHAPSASDTYTDTTTSIHETTTPPVPSEPIPQPPVTPPINTEASRDIPAYHQEPILPPQVHPEAIAETKTEALHTETQNEKNTEG